MVIFSLTNANRQLFAFPIDNMSGFISNLYYIIAYRQVATKHSMNAVIR